MSFLSDLLSPIASSDFVTSAKMVAKGIGLLVDDWVALDPEDGIIQSVAQTFSTLWNTYVTIAIQGGFLDTAALIGNPNGDPRIAANAWIKLLASSVFNVQAIAATFATGGWTGGNSTPGNLGPYAPGALKFYCIDTNTTYSNRDNVTFVPGSNAPIVIVADVIGSGSNAAPTRVVLNTTVLGLSGTNALAITALDDESGPALAVRCRLKYASISPNGPSQAYQYVALTPTLNGGVAVNRVSVSPSSTNGSVTVTIAGPSGPVAGGDVTTVNNALYGVSPTPGGVVPDTVRLNTQSATGHSIAVTWTAYYHAGANIVPSTEVANGNAALVAAFQTFPIGGDVITGGFVYFDELVAVLARALPKAFQIALALPGADVSIGATEVPTLGATTGTATVVS